MSPGLWIGAHLLGRSLGSLGGVGYRKGWGGFASVASLHLEYFYEKHEQGARLIALVIGSEHRGVRSVGRALISAAEDWARRRGAGEVMLTTHKRRADAHRFYRRLGFVDSHVGMKLDLTRRP